MQRYRITRLLASGGMAEVYLGVATGAEGFEKPVAMKRVLPHLAVHADIARMFLTEAEIARHLHHQNIVEVIDVGRTGEGLFLVMEAVNGWDLGRLLTVAQERGTTFPPHLAGYLVAQVNAGLCHAYSRRVNGAAVVTAHRDIADSNILVSREGEVKVADFGIARPDLAQSQTAPGVFKGRLQYAAPELLHGEPASAASDQFALGIVLTELVTGQAPWGSPSDNLAAYIQRVDLEPPSLGKMPPALASIAARMLAHDPAQRYPPAELSRALAQFLASSGAPAGPQELAEFVEGLRPPPPALERTDAEVVPPTALGAQSFSIRHDELWAETGAEPDLELGAGAALDASGRLSRPVAQPAPSAASASAPASARRPPEALAPALTQEKRAPDDEPLELAREVRRDESVATADGGGFQFGEPAPKRGVWKPVVAIAVLLAIGAGAYLLWPAAQRPVYRELRGLSAQPMLRIESEPSGATVLVDGQELGQTPLVLDNVYPSTEVKIEVRRTGFEPWRGKFRGGEDATVEARLVRRGSGKGR